MTTHRDPKTGKFAGRELTPPTTELADHQHEHIVQRFVEAARPPQKNAVRWRRWTWPLALAVAVEVGCLMGAAWEYSATQPQITDLGLSLERENKLVKQAHEAFHNLFQADDRLEKAEDHLKQQNADLWQRYGVLVESYNQEKASKQDAAHKLGKGERILQDEQNHDELNNRERTARAIRLINEAAQALKEPSK